MMDSAQEIRNGHIDKREGLALIEKFDGEYPSKYEQEFLEYVSMTKNELLKFVIILDQIIYGKKSNRWELKLTPSEYFKNLYKRLIARLDIKNNYLVKGINFEGLRVLVCLLIFRKNTLKTGLMKYIIKMLWHHYMEEIH